MKIYTNRYHDFTPSQGIPVLTTYGSPRWRLPYTIAASAKTVTPGRWFMEGTNEEFTERYRAMPDSHGVARIRTELETISQLNGGKDIVLLCFDDVKKACATERFSPNGGRKRPVKKSRNYKKVWRPPKMCHSNDRCDSAPSSPDRAPDPELEGTKFDSWGRSDGRSQLTVHIVPQHLG